MLLMIDNYDQYPKVSVGIIDINKYMQLAAISIRDYLVLS